MQNPVRNTDVFVLSQNSKDIVEILTQNVIDIFENSLHGKKTIEKFYSNPDNSYIKRRNDFVTDLDNKFFNKSYIKLRNDFINDFMNDFNREGYKKSYIELRNGFLNYFIIDFDNNFIKKSYSKSRNDFVNDFLILNL